MPSSTLNRYKSYLLLVSLLAQLSSCATFEDRDITKKTEPLSTKQKQEELYNRHSMLTGGGSLPPTGTDVSCMLIQHMCHP